MRAYFLPVLLVFAACSRLAPADPNVIPPGEYAPAQTKKLPPEEARMRLIEALRKARWIDTRAGNRCGLMGLVFTDAGMEITLKDKISATVETFKYPYDAPAPRLNFLATKGWSIVRFPPFFSEEVQLTPGIRPPFRGYIEATFDAMGADAAREVVDISASLRAL